MIVAEGSGNVGSRLGQTYDGRYQTRQARLLEEN